MTADPYDSGSAEERSGAVTPQARASRRSSSYAEGLATFSELAGIPVDADRLAVLEPEVVSLLDSARAIWEADPAEDGEARSARTPPRGATTARPAENRELSFLSLQEAALLVASRDLSAMDLTDAALARADTVGTALNCFTTVLEDQARDQARALDRLLRAGVRVGPLHGVPVTVKDNIAVAGAPMTAGSPVFAGLPEAKPQADAEAVRRLRAAGAVVIAKTSLYEFAFGEASARFGHTLNPWDGTRSTGGSSSGSVCSTAAGVGYASLATDTGGSIRVPSAFCGLVGLKPTRRRVSRDGVVPVSATLDHVGPIAREAADARLVLHALTGGGDRPPARPLPALTVGVAAVQPSERCDAGVRAAVESVAPVLAERGARLVEIELPDLLLARTVLWIIASAEAAEHHRSWLLKFGGRYHPLVRGRLERAQFLPAIAYVRARRLQRDLAQALMRLFTRVDAVLLPTAPIPAYPLGARTARLEGADEDVSELVTRYTPLFSLAGCPAISFQCGSSAEGMPVGAQLAAAPGHDETVLALAEAYQEATAWHRSHPPEAEDRSG